MLRIVSSISACPNNLSVLGAVRIHALKELTGLCKGEKICPIVKGIIPCNAEGDMFSNDL